MRVPRFHPSDNLEERSLAATSGYLLAPAVATGDSVASQAPVRLRGGMRLTPPRTASYPRYDSSARPIVAFKTQIAQQQARVRVGSRSDRPRRVVLLRLERHRLPFAAPARFSRSDLSR